MTSAPAPARWSAARIPAERNPDPSPGSCRYRDNGTARVRLKLHVLQCALAFVQPTIVRDISDNSRLVCEEQFGPVLPVLRYSDIDDAIARAHDTDYGLGGSVWSYRNERSQAVDRSAQDYL